MLIGEACFRFRLHFVFVPDTYQMMIPLDNVGILYTCQILILTILFFKIEEKNCVLLKYTGYTSLMPLGMRRDSRGFIFFLFMINVHFY